MGERSQDACRQEQAGGLGTEGASSVEGARSAEGAAPLPKRAAVFCVGNRLMMDEGVGPAVYDALLSDYVIPDNVRLFDVGCMSLDMLNYVDEFDFLLTVDAVDKTGDPAGTVYRFPPDAMARHTGAMSSLHDLKLVDLFDSAALLGYAAEGFCVGMQIENMYPAEFVMDLTPPVRAALPLLIETTVAELARRGFVLERKPTS